MIVNRGSPSLQKMSVLHIAEHVSRGGASRAAFRLHQALVEDGRVSSDFLSLSEARSSQVSVEGAGKTDNTVIFQNSILHKLAMLFRHFLGTPGRMIFDFFFFRNFGLESEVLRRDPDLIVIHWVRARDLPLRSIRRLKRPTLIVLHDARFLLGIRHYPKRSKEARGALTVLELITSRIMKASLTSPSLSLICPSEWMKKTAQRCTWTGESMHVLPYPIDLDFWSPSSGPRAKSDGAVKRIAFGFSGAQSAARKGQDLLFKAISLLENEGVQVSFRLEVSLFGDASPPKDFKIPQGTKILTLGNLTDTELRDLYQSIDLIVVPSRNENLAQIVLEAQATGTPALVAKSTGLESAISPKSGRTFRNGSALDLAQRLHELLDDQDLLNLQAIAAREYALSEWSWDTISEKFLALSQGPKTPNPRS